MRQATIVACFAGLLLLLPPEAGAQAQKHDADQPIEINADSLEVLQKDQRAVFRGNVDAQQGRIRLKADELEVHYRGKGKGEAGQVGGSITRIDARGSVFVSSPTETAQGDVGVYDVTAKEITLTGKVVLTRGDNVIRGQRLVLNLVTGKSRIEGGRGRVRGYFVPGRKGATQ
jgi:lipopolysaccharide export system protein LptA